MTKLFDLLLASIGRSSDQKHQRATQKRGLDHQAEIQGQAQAHPRLMNEDTRLHELLLALRVSHATARTTLLPHAVAAEA